ncbi:hypothetical protein DS742_14165 [Lacrimispora amygdalina]|uniref:Uncharacterized protein n=1 Tax=Lacrimispora amygdalina TaxID=253257 RepID=A0A3E2NBB9_9FIRM|nr:hypothetical protein [Clostridium indicum]RFZ78254.1 hypothetical protein DS742_14165 [Clostridium indicum]
MNETLESIKYVEANKLHEEANKLAIKVGNIYMASLMLYKNIPLTEKNIAICKKIVLERKENENKWFTWFINGGWKEDLK